jgi:hypothetical protein
MRPPRLGSIRFSAESALDGSAVVEIGEFFAKIIGKAGAWLASALSGAGVEVAEELSAQGGGAALSA